MLQLDLRSPNSFNSLMNLFRLLNLKRQDNELLFIEHCIGNIQVSCHLLHQLFITHRNNI